MGQKFLPYDHDFKKVKIFSIKNITKKMSQSKVRKYWKKFKGVSYESEKIIMKMWDRNFLP